MKTFKIRYTPKEGGAFSTHEHGVNNMIQAVREMVKDGCTEINITQVKP